MAHISFSTIVAGLPTTIVEMKLILLYDDKAIASPYARSHTLTTRKKGEKMKMASARNRQGSLGVVLVIAALAVVGCTMHGGGVVALFDVDTGLGAGVPTDANVAVSVNCNGNTNEVRSIIHWTDNTNGANFTARLPWTPISEIFPVATCEEAAAIVSNEGASVSVGVINSRGQESGDVLIAVSAPGEGATACGDLQTVEIQATGTEDVLPGGFYGAIGCLDHGKISFGQTP